MTIQYVCISDTHFGAENSILTNLHPGSGVTDPSNPSPVLSSLIDCLRVLIRTNDSAAKPQLILNGDILELALAQDNVAAMVFDRFVDLAFSPGHELFDTTILYIPGNHDHHLWETAREHQYAEWVRNRPADTTLETPWHVTTLLHNPNNPFPTAGLLTALVQRRVGQQLRVQLAYPNLGLASGNERLVLFHHGHFTEPLYTLMSAAKKSLFPSQPPIQEIWDWEEDNFAWIDFFWSCLGRSGEVGDDVGLVYDMLQEPRALAALSKNLAAAGTTRLPPLVRHALHFATSEVVKHIARRVKKRERTHPKLVLSPSGELGLDGYLSLPLRTQALRECPDLRDREVSFVFGHTHKPFEQRRTVPSYEHPVDVYNTGGWVVDTITPAPLQGAALVLIDDQCNTASIRLYNQSAGLESSRASLAEPLGTANELHEALSSSLDFRSDPWTTFSSAASEAVALRHQLLPKFIERGLRLTNPPALN